MKNLASVLSHEWLEESELSSEVIRLDSPSTSIQCQINLEPFKALYNPIVGVNIMSASFALPIMVDEILVRMSFYIYDIIEFDLLIGQPIQRLLLEGQIGKLNICLGKNI
jgi:hypothetical protein